MKVVSNTGPLLHLTEAQNLDLLHLTGDVFLPPCVERELIHHISAWQTPEWMSVIPLTQTHSTQAAIWVQAGVLDAGEAEAVMLSQQLGADWFLTDDTAARLLAKTLNIEVHGSLGIVLWATAVGHLSFIEAEQALDRLHHSSLWISSKILTEARDALKSMFIP